MIADLHIHSKYARACSNLLTLENINATCLKKGIDLVGTGDFTFPDWLKEVEVKLEEIDRSGFYKLKQAKGDKFVKFILSAEVSLIYDKKGKSRRIHLLLHAPNISVAKKLNRYLDKHYNIQSDGRPILGIDAVDFVRLLFSIDDRFIVYPAHIWTPWYGIFGSQSGFDTIEDCFGEWSPYIHAFETGLSSDPEMNWRVSSLDHLTMISCSDAHNLFNIGREATVFRLKDENYDGLFNLIKNKLNRKTIDEAKMKDASFLDFTIEFFPEEGRYHFDGHRACRICLDPSETRKHGGICPVCQKPLTIGVLNRLYELADRSEGIIPENAADFVKLVELDKIIAESIDIKNRESRKVRDIYDIMIAGLGPEIPLLLKPDFQGIKEVAGEKIAKGIRKMRDGELIIVPGYDGEYGKIRVFEDSDL